jgi:hypothetical protein
MDTLAIAFPAGVFLFMITLLFFQSFSKHSFFTLLLWIGIPMIAYIMSVLVLMGAQTSVCDKIDASKALLGSIPTVIAVLIGLGVSYISFCRIPIASVFAPMFVDHTIDVVRSGSSQSINSLRNSKNSSKNSACCSPIVTLEAIEDKFPMVTGLSYGFYVFFASMFGLIVGAGTATTC